MLGFPIKPLMFSSTVLLLSFILSGCNPLENKIKSGLQVETGGAPASLFLNAQYLEKTPYINKEIKPGTYTLKIQPDDSKLPAYETSITLRKGLLTVVKWQPGEMPELSGGVIYEMEKGNNQKKSDLTIITIPDAGIIELEGRSKEFAPVTLSDLEPGEKKYSISLPSYNSLEQTVNLLPGYHTIITVKLAKTQYGVPSFIPNPVTTLASPSASLSASAAGQLNTTLPKVTDGSKVIIKSTNFFQTGQEVLRVREKNQADAKTIAFARVGGEYQYLGETVSGWHKIMIDGQNGWVSGQYATLIK